MHFPEYLSCRKYIHSQQSEIVAKCMKMINSMFLIIICAAWTYILFSCSYFDKSKMKKDRISFLLLANAN